MKKRSIELPARVEEPVVKLTKMLPQGWYLALPVTNEMDGFRLRDVMRTVSKIFDTMESSAKECVVVWIEGDEKR